MMIACSSKAQTITPNAVVPDEIRPAKKINPLEISEPGTTSNNAPANAENLEITLSDVVISTSLPQLKQATNRLIQRLTGQKIPVSAIYSQASELEQAYANAGYILARVVVPPQKLINNGQLHIHIVDGFIEEIDVSNLPKATREAVLNRTRHLLHRSGLKLTELERALLIAGDMPGVRLKSTLIRGKQEGGTRLTISCDCQRASISLGMDNHLDRSLDRWQAATVISFNSLSGEQIYGIIGTGGGWNKAFTHDATVSLYGLGLTLPIGYQGLILNPEYINSSVRPLSEPNILRTQGDFERYALRLSYPAIRTRNELLNLKLGVDYIRQRTEALDFNVDLNRDRYRVLRAGLDYQLRLQNQASLQTNITFAQGLGGRNANDAQKDNVPLSRQEATPDFTKLSAAIHLSQPLYQNIRLDMAALGQTSFNHALLRAEQFSLDGKDGLSPFSSGTLITDQGAILRVELSNSWTARFGERYIISSPYLFLAGGWGKNIAPTTAENDTLHAHAWGLGTRANLINNQQLPVSLGFEIGEGFSSENNYRHLWRGMFNLLLSY
jgi:hemolysin activation/secretion protein